MKDTDRVWAEQQIARLEQHATSATLRDRAAVRDGHQRWPHEAKIAEALIKAVGNIAAAVLRTNDGEPEMAE